MPLQQARQITEPDDCTPLDDMFFSEGSDIPINRFIVPRVEDERAFVMGKRLQGPRVTIFKMLEATENAANAGIITGGRPVKPNASDLCRVSAMPLGSITFKFICKHLSTPSNKRFPKSKSKSACG